MSLRSVIAGWRTRSAAVSRAAIAASLVLASIGCSARCAPTSWQIEFFNPPLERDARSVVVHVRQGTCASPGEVLDTRTLTPGGMRTQLPSFGAGPFALEATALDESCRPIASACTDVSASSCPSPIAQTLVEVTPGEPACAACNAGVCPAATDAGARIDAGPSDAGPRDSGNCRVAEMDCTDGSDDDCDGTIDCADGDCDGMPGACGGICGHGVCCNGCFEGTSCESGNGRRSCGSGGNECADCWPCRCEERSCRC